ncbi:MAG: T9SS type B sorting domain-containing protein [Bacteroidales bacterium]
MTGMLLAVPLSGILGQLTSPTADLVDSVSYPGRVAEDPLFVFYQFNGASVPGTLAATLPGGGSYNFEWSRYNPDIGAFDPPFSSETNMVSSTVSDLEDGGYQVRIWNGTNTDTTFLGWVMLDKLTAQVTKDANDEVLPIYSTCNFLVVIGAVEPDTLRYYNPVTNQLLEQPIGYKFKWTSDNEDHHIPNDSTVLKFNITYIPPVKDTWVILTVTDELGMVEVDSVFCSAKATRAEFTVEYLDKVLADDPEKMWNPDLTEGWTKDIGSTDALLTVRFLNDSKNGENYEFVFLDTLGGIKQTYETGDVDELPEFTYTRADEYYYPYLVSTSSFGCIDTFELAEAIFVAPSQLVIPNVFSPNGDGTNDFWVFKHQSLKTCRITVVDRTGKVAYKRDIDDIYSWEGWDGNMHDSNRRAPEGQYYFVVEAMGYDGKEFRDPNLIERWKENRGKGSNTGGGTGTGGTDGTAVNDNLYTGWLYLYRHTGTY